jgi:hypothetical protein
MEQRAATVKGISGTGVWATRRKEIVIKYINVFESHVDVKA